MAFPGDMPLDQPADAYFDVDEEPLAEIPAETTQQKIPDALAEPAESVAERAGVGPAHPLERPEAASEEETRTVGQLDLAGEEWGGGDTPMSDDDAEAIERANTVRRLYDAGDEAMSSREAFDAYLSSKLAAAGVTAGGSITEALQQIPTSTIADWVGELEKAAASRRKGKARQ
jgi:hypothetical protein